MRSELGVVVLLAACSGGSVEPQVDPECEELTYDNFGRGFLLTWCTSCHSSELQPGDRYGAPEGIDFDSLGAVQKYAPLIRAVATGPDPSMPEKGGPDVAERQRLAAWLECGAPGGSEEEERVRCTDPLEVVSGSVDIGASADRDPLCGSAPVRIEGDLTVSATAALDCVCEVGGSVRIEGGQEVSLEVLTEVSGDVRAVGAAPLEVVAVPRLREVGGSLVFTDLPALREVLLPAVSTVGEDLVLERLDAATRVDLTRVQAVGGDFVLRAMPRFQALEGDAGNVESIGGDLVLADLDDWLVGLYAFDWLETVGGRVEISGNDRITQVRGFNKLVEASGLRIAGNSRLGILGGFGSLPALEGDLRIADNPVLDRIDSLESLERVAGAFELLDNPMLSNVQGVSKATSYGALRIERSGLSGLPAWGVEQVEGDLILRDLPNLQGITALGSLASVGGALIVADAPRLVEIGELTALGYLGGDLVLDELGALGTAPGLPVLEDLGGTLEVRDSGLASLEGAEALRTVGGLTLVDNPALTDVSGLHGLTLVAGDVRVEGNAALSRAATDTLLAEIDAVDGAVIVGGNAAD